MELSCFLIHSRRQERYCEVVSQGINNNDDSFLEFSWIPTSFDRREISIGSGNINWRSGTGRFVVEYQPGQEKALREKEYSDNVYDTALISDSLSLGNLR